MRERLGNVIAVDEPPLDGPADVRHPDDGVVISRGTRVYLRTFTRSDLAWLTDWVEDPYLERMVGSEFLHSFKHDWDKAPGFHDAVRTDPTQVVVMVEAGWTKPVGVVRLFNIHLLEGYAFLFGVCAFAYLVAFAVHHVLAPRLEPIPAETLAAA